MRIELAALEGGKGSFTHSYAPGELVLQDDRIRLLAAPIVSGEIRLKERRVHLKGRVAARLQLECDRCLRPVELPVDSAFKLEYVTAEDYQAQQAVELNTQDLDFSIFDGEAVDIDELVTEELLLAVPDHVLCSENCRGICPVCGVDRNSAGCECQTAEIDPRWAGLKQLVNGKS
jgi:uncharacterized protein